MQEIDRVHTGASVYTVSSTGHYKNYVCYMGNFNIIIYQLDPFKHLHTLSAPCDLRSAGQSIESSGIVAMDVSTGGMLAVATRQGNVFTYQLPQADKVLNSLSIDYKHKNAEVLTERQVSKLSIQILKFHPQRTNIIFCFEEQSKEIVILNLTNNRIFAIQTPDYINVMSVVDDSLLVGSALEGNYQQLNDLNTMLDMLETQDQSPQKSIFKYIQCERELNEPVEKDTIFTSSYLQWLNIHYYSAFSIDFDIDAQNMGRQVISCWYDGLLQIHDNKNQSNGIASKLGERFVKLAKCACFVQGKSGVVAVGFSNGLIQFVNVTSIIKEMKQQYYGVTKLNDKVNNLLNKQSNVFPDDEVIQQIQITKLGQIITIHSFNFTSTSGQNKIVLYGVTSSGSFFIYEYLSQQLIHSTQSNHTESIFQFLPHPSFHNLFASLSADATVKIWKDSPQGLQLDQQFGQSGYTRFSRTHQTEFAFKNSNTAKTGGMIDSQQVTGSLLSGAWDPRKESCLMMLGGFKGNIVVCDIWRSNVFVTFPRHSKRVQEIQWTNFPKCMACSVSFDGTARIYLFEGTLSLNDDKLETVDNYDEFVNHPDVSLNGCHFSPHEPLLAISSQDGYVRVYDLRVFSKTKEEVKQIYNQQNVDNNMVAPIQIGKFSVSDKPLFRVMFHPKMRNVIGISCDTGEVKIYRYEFDGQQNFKVQCAATLVGHTNNARPIQFHPEIPYIIISGSWDGSVIVWNWVTSEQLAKFKFDSDVYGMAISPHKPFEVLVSSRDLSIRKLYLKELSNKYTIHTLFTPIIQQINQFIIENNASNDYLKKQFNINTTNKQIIQTLKNGLVTMIQPPSYKQMKEKTASELLILCGILSEQTLIDMNSDSILLTIAQIINIFYPSDSGAKQLLETLNYLNADEHDMYVSNILEDTFAYQEYKFSQGICLSGRSLCHMFTQLGTHYLKSMFSDMPFTVNKEFTTQKYQFYQFQRKLPNNKAEAYKYQFNTGLMFLAASLQIEQLTYVLRAANCQEQVFFENVEMQNVKYSPDSLNIRLQLKDSMPQYLKRLIEAVGIYQLSKDESCLKQVIQLLQQQNLFCVGKVISYQLKNEELMKQVSFQQAIQYCQQKQFIKAALELITVNELEKATLILSLSGESLLASLCCISNPEDSDQMSMFGAAEMCYKNQLDPSLLLKLGRGFGISGAQVCKFLPQWFNFELIQKQFQQLCGYLKYFKEQKPIKQDYDKNQLLQFSTERFYIQLQILLQPQNVLHLMNVNGGDSLQQRFQIANSFLLNIVNDYVKQRILYKPLQQIYKQSDLFVLYNLFRHRHLGLNNTVYEAAFLSNYLGAIYCGQKHGFFNTSAFMFSQAEKIQLKFSVLQEIKNVRALKFAQVYMYSNKAENIKNRILESDKEYDFQLHDSIYKEENYDAEDIQLVNAISNQALRCVFTPFDLKLQPLLNICPVFLDIE